MREAYTDRIHLDSIAVRVMVWIELPDILIRADTQNSLHIDLPSVVIFWPSQQLIERHKCAPFRVYLRDLRRRRALGLLTSSECHNQ